MGSARAVELQVMTTNATEASSAIVGKGEAGIFVVGFMGLHHGD